MRQQWHWTVSFPPYEWTHCTTPFPQFKNCRKEAFISHFFLMKTHQSQLCVYVLTRNLFPTCLPSTRHGSKATISDWRKQNPAGLISHKENFSTCTGLCSKSLWYEKMNKWPSFGRGTVLLCLCWRASWDWCSSQLVKRTRKTRYFLLQNVKGETTYSTVSNII